MFFKYQLMTALGSSDQFDNPYAHFPLAEACSHFAGTAANGSAAVLAWAAFMRTQDQGACLVADEEAYLAPLADSSNAERSWFYQKCNEFGWFKTSRRHSSVFFQDLDIDYMVAWCERIFGIKGMAPDTDGTNRRYGGQTNLMGTNILFTNGDFDPWHLVSITSPVNQVEAITYEAGHCAPMTMPLPNDPPSLTMARTRVRDWVKDKLA